MGRKRHTPEQIITALREAEVGLARGKSVKLISREQGGMKVSQVVGSAALVERRDVVGFQVASAAAVNAPPAVALEGGAARLGPSRASRRESAQDQCAERCISSVAETQSGQGHDSGS